MGLMTFSCTQITYFGYIHSITPVSPHTPSSPLSSANPLPNLTSLPLRTSMFHQRVWGWFVRPRVPLSLPPTPASIHCLENTGESGTSPHCVFLLHFISVVMSTTKTGLVSKGYRVVQTPCGQETGTLRKQAPCFHHARPDKPGSWPEQGPQMKQCLQGINWRCGKGLEFTSDSHRAHWAFTTRPTAWAAINPFPTSMHIFMFGLLRILHLRGVMRTSCNWLISPVVREKALGYRCKAGRLPQQVFQ